MSDKQSEIPMSKKGQREVSPFVGHELLYDYLCGKLDSERKKAVEDHVKYSRDAQLDLTKIQNGQNYAERLSLTVVSEPVLEKINSPATYLSVLMEKSNFERWPIGLKWGLEALVVVSVIVLLLTIAPWEKVMKIGVSPTSKDVILAEVTKTDRGTTELAKKADQDTPKFADEGAPGKAETKVDVKVTATPAVVPPVAIKSGTTVNPPVTAAPGPVKSPPSSAAQAVSGAKANAEEEGDLPKPQSGGFLYRGSVQITNLEMAGPKITEKIKELGGRKAGDVELGWKKTEHSSYYHFTIPEAKYQELFTFISNYGKTKIIKEKHPRVMPDGIIRLIITVDDDQKEEKK